MQLLVLGITLEMQTLTQRLFILTARLSTYLMKTRLRCPWHHEKTASLVRRKNDWRCYGACNKAYTHEEVEAKIGESVPYEYEEEDESKEDLTERFRYINSLPRQSIRGLKLPADERGYFIPWDDGSYYKYRLFNPGKGGKYLSPKGYRPALYWARRKGGSALLLVEGEMNALSIAEAIPTVDVCSPGSATNFNLRSLSNYLTQFSRYSNILVVLDEDAAGMKGLIECKAAFLYKLPFVNYILMKPDANEILCGQGAKALRERLQGRDGK